MVGSGSGLADSRKNEFNPDNVSSRKKEIKIIFTHQFTPIRNTYLIATLARNAYDYFFVKLVHLFTSPVGVGPSFNVVMQIKTLQ